METAINDNISVYIDDDIMTEILSYCNDFEIILYCDNLNFPVDIVCSPIEYRRLSMTTLAIIDRNTTMLKNCYIEIIVYFKSHNQKNKFKLKYL